MCQLKLQQICNYILHEWNNNNNNNNSNLVRLWNRRTDGDKKPANEKGSTLITTISRENRQALPATLRILNIDFGFKNWEEYYEFVNNYLKNVGDLVGLSQA
jgi:hypothetical protein